MVCFVEIRIEHHEGIDAEKLGEHAAGQAATHAGKLERLNLVMAYAELLTSRGAGRGYCLPQWRFTRKRCGTDIVVVTRTGPDVCGHERRQHF